MTERTSPLSDAPTWGDRLEAAINEWDDLNGIPAMLRMDRAFKRAGVRDLIVERDRLETALRACSAAAGNPDAADGCRQVIRIVKEAFGFDIPV